MKQFFLANLLTATFLLSGFISHGQKAYWSFVAHNEALEKNLHRPSMPLNFKVLKLNLESLKQDLEEAPLWNTDEAGKKSVVIELPMPDGSFQKFVVTNAPVMEDELARKYPYIQSYVGYSMSDPTAYLRFCINGHGFDGTILSGNHNPVIISPYEWGKTDYYIVNNFKDLRSEGNFTCGFEDEFLHQGGTEIKLQTGNEKMGACALRSLRVAIAADSKYSQARGGTVQSVMDAITTRLTQVNALFESEVNLHLNLVNGNDAIIFPDSQNDPYNINYNCSQLFTINNQTINQLIQPINYDIGHLFTTSIGAGGCADIYFWSCEIQNTQRANGLSGEDQDVNNASNRMIMPHEMGHQFGAMHSINRCKDLNNSLVYYGPAGAEPGSGTTIMGYAGRCNPTPQSLSDLNYHAFSLAQIIATLNQSSCALPMDQFSQPSANAGMDMTVPLGTPFALKAVAPSMGTGHTFCWEQIDSEIAPNNNGDPPSMPKSNFKVGPLVRAYPPSGSNTRHIPDLTELVNNNLSGWEVLPTVPRTMNFRLTVRNGHCPAFDDMSVTVANCGPFKVLTPVANDNWIAGTLATITWDVAGTNAHPVNCKLVNIFLSTDGGLTFPVQLASETPNDGSHTITVPGGMNTTKARVMVKASADTFFDISDDNHIISGPANDFFIAFATPPSHHVCAPFNRTYTFVVAPIGNFNGTVFFSSSNLPNGVTASFQPSSVSTLPAVVNMTVHGSSNASQGFFDLIINAFSPGMTVKRRIVQLDISAGLPQPIFPASPPNGAIDVTASTTLKWNPGNGTSFHLQLASSPSFSAQSLVVDLSGLSLPEYRVTAALAPGTTYYWRVGATNNCGTVNWTNTAFYPVFSFTTVADVECDTKIPTDLILGIWDGTGSSASKVTVPINQSGKITDVNVKNLHIFNVRIGDITIKLRSPLGTEVTLFEHICGEENSLKLSFDDEASSSILPCPPIGFGTYKPLEPFSIFDGENSKGTWSLIAMDSEPQSIGGSNSGLVDSWELEFCYEPITGEEDPDGGDEPGLGGNDDGNSKQLGFSSNNLQGVSPSEMEEKNVLETDPTEFLLNVFPNPSNNQLKVQFIQISPLAEIRFFDMLGREQLGTAITSHELGYQETTFDTSGLSDGAYLLKIKDGQRTASKLVVVLHH